MLWDIRVFQLPEIQASAFIKTREEAQAYPQGLSGMYSLKQLYELKRNPTIEIYEIYGKIFRINPKTSVK
jgi:hypothetical protein